MLKMEIKPLIKNNIKEFLDYFRKKENRLNFDSKFLSGVNHLVFPDILEENYNNLKKINLDNLDVYFAIKSTYSKSLIKKASEIGFGVEVSSYNELKLALEFDFKKIIAGGPKNIKYLSLAIENNVLISVDSLDELNHISKKNFNAEVLLRISNPICEDRNIKVRVSRFGISRDELNSALEILNKSSLIKLRGFHFHADGYDAETKRGFIKYFLDLSLELKNKGFLDINLINIGGGFRNSLLEDPKQWLDFIGYIEKTLLSNGDLEIWGNYGYGVEINSNNKIQKRNYAESKGIKSNILSDLDLILNSKIIDESISLNDLFYENDFKLIIEPGFYLSTNAGITIIDVIGSKKSSCGADLVLVDGNMFSLSNNMIEHLTDPELFYLDEKKEEENFSAYIIGNLCREDDFLMKRKICFTQKPKLGDKLIFFNTGSYAMSYEKCNPQRQETANYFFVNKLEKTNKVLNNNLYEIKNDN